MSLSDPESNNVAVLLMEKYALLKKEIHMLTGFCKSHVRYFQLLAGAIVVLGGFVLSKPDQYLPSGQNWWLWWGCAVLISVIANYLILDLCESQYLLILLGERMATIEEELNRLIGRRVFIWETHGSPMFFSSLRPMPGIIQPDWGLTFCGLLIVVVIALIIPFSIYWTLWRSDFGKNSLLITGSVYGGGLLSGLLTGFSIYVFISILRKMHGRVRVELKKILSRKFPD